MTPTRRAIVLAAGASAVAVPPARASTRPTRSIEGSLPVSAFRSADFADDDFTDLEPFAQAIEGARIVQLGEPSHGAGASFSAKARLVRFLHARMGFDLLIWESGLYDVSLTEAGLAAGEDPGVAARRGVFGLWSNAREVAPLFAYAQASHAGPRPLRMAGFDLQVTAPGSRQRFAGELTAFATALRDRRLRARALAAAAAGIAARDRLYATRFSDERDLEALSKAAEALLEVVRAHRATMSATAGRTTAEFMGHAIENMRLDARQRFEAARSPGPTVERENRRDTRNFQILRWLLERAHPRRKAIVWAHNAHVMNAFYGPDFRVARARGQPGDMRPMGVPLKAWLGRGVYTLGITGYSGQDALVAPGAKTSEIAPAGPGSLEAIWHELSAPYLFADFAGSGRKPPRSAATARFPKYDLNPVQDLVEAYDGLLFIDRMKPATPLDA